MRIGALVSTGKDSLFAAYHSSKNNELVCLIAIKSKNPHSYMFHIPNVHLAELQAEAMELPLVLLETEGIKEEELDDLKSAMEIAKSKYKIEGVVSGAIASNYQKKRIEGICRELNLNSLTPLWQINNTLYLKELIRDFEVIITSIAADGLEKSDLGKRLDLFFLDKLNKLHEKNGISMVFEGGEAETFVLDCPLFKKKLVVEESEKQMESECCGQYVIKKIKLVNKQSNLHL